jgi:hypothetical protein
MTICKKCLMDDSIKGVSIGEDGVCNLCKTWERIEERRMKETEKLPAIYEKLKKGFIIGLSGGVDSSSCLDLLVVGKGIRPKLAFSMDNGWNNPLADENVKRLIDHFKIPFYKYNINLDRFKELQQAFLESGVPNIEIPTDHILMAVSYEMAVKNKVKYIVGGGNHASEGIMPESWSYRSGDLKQMRAIYKKFTGKRLRGLPTCGLLKFNYYKWIRGIKVVNLLDYYIEYNKENSKNILEMAYGWQDYGGKHEESIYTQWFQNCYLPVKFKIDKRVAHYSSLINSGQISREAAIKKLEEPLTFKPIISVEDFMKYPIHSHSDYPNNQKLYDFLCKVVRFIRNICHSK